MTMTEHSKMAKGRYDKLIHGEDRDLALEIASYHHIRNGEQQKDGSVGIIKITHKEMKDIIAYALEHFAKRPKQGCKDCWGRGKIIRTAPRKDIKKKTMVRARTDCHCVRIKEEEKNETNYGRIKRG